MSEFSARRLSPGFARTVLGFDRRVRPSRHQQERSEIPWLGDWFDVIGPRVTFEALVWPTKVYYGVGSDNNGYNLLQNLNELSTSPEDHSVRVAFDTPELLSQFLYPPLPPAEYACAPSLSELAQSKDWTFLGFDVVDIRTRSSAFFSSNWDTKELHKLLSSADVTLDEVGTIREENMVIRACQFFSEEVYETRDHAPFIPCGIWVAK